MHLADLLRAEGVPIHWKDPEFAGLKVSAIWFERQAMGGVDKGILASDGPGWVIVVTRCAADSHGRTRSTGPSLIGLRGLR